MTDPRPGQLVTALACDRRVRVLVAVVDAPAHEMCRRHGLHGEAAVLAGEGLAASVLLSSQLKGKEQLSVNIHGERPAFRFVADVREGIDVRARLEVSDALPAEGQTRFDGLMAIHKFLDDHELHQGMAAVEDGTMVEAFQGLLDRSVQVDGRVKLRARLDDDGNIAVASGMLVERLPDMDPEEFAGLVEHPLRDDFDTVMTVFAFGQLAGTAVEVLDSQQVRFRCQCSAERVHSMLRALGNDELESMLAEQGHAEVTCHFCNETYRVDGEGLKELIGELGA